MEIKVSTENGRVPVTVLHVDGNTRLFHLPAIPVHSQKTDRGWCALSSASFFHAPFVSSADIRALHTLFNELRTRNPKADLSDEQMKKRISQAT